MGVADDRSGVRTYVGEQRVKRLEVRQSEVEVRMSMLHARLGQARGSGSEMESRWNASRWMDSTAHLDVYLAARRRI